MRFKFYENATLFGSVKNAQSRAEKRGWRRVGGGKERNSEERENIRSVWLVIN